MLLSLTSQIARVFSLTAIFTLLVLISTSHACDWCNNQFFMELNSDREGTLVADELLASIRAQHDFEELAARAQMETSASASASPSSEATPVPAGVSVIALVLAAFAAFLGFIAMIKRSDD